MANLFHILSTTLEYQYPKVVFRNLVVSSSGHRSGHRDRAVKARPLALYLNLPTVVTMNSPRSASPISFSFQIRSRSLMSVVQF